MFKEASARIFQWDGGRHPYAFCGEALAEIIYFSGSFGHNPMIDSTWPLKGKPDSKKGVGWTY